MEMTMNSDQTVTALSALAHEHRLGVYRMLVEAGPEGLNAGTIAARLAMPSSSLTFHLQHLHRAGLITQERQGRQLIYAADFDVMRGLVGYLTENCCGGGSKQTAFACAPARARKPARKAARPA
jgi:ArsR family transcriptional regulator, arsenate/arsenite/antimonite-responsive transcriptional repressor